LGLEHPLRNLFRHLSLESYLCPKGYPYPLLHVKIFLLGGVTMKGMFLNVAFFTKQILGIPRSQIEMENVFNLVGV